MLDSTQDKCRQTERCRGFPYFFLLIWISALALHLWAVDEEGLGHILDLQPIVAPDMMRICGDIEVHV